MNGKINLFLKNRKKIDYQSSPINIYEMNLLSWKKKDGHEINYNEIKIELVKYLKKLNYNYVEFMPLMEYPFDGSWGYQTTGFFNPTSRFGNPKELMSLIDYLHRNGIGVILDFVFVHFVKDDHGLRSFDGKAQFESSDKNLAENYDWGTLNFDLSKKEVRNFLISSALYWLDYYHIDGLRLDAVSYSLYYDIKNLNYNEELKSNINPNAISFIKEFNTKVKEYYPDIMIIAEESSSYPNICKKVVDGGLGFDFKWNMGWMNDIIKYMNMDPLFRKDNHKALTFPIYYQYTENFILPFSHDEVVHAKGSMLNKMFGNYEDRFKQLRLLYTYFYSEPGKKLLFMGGEFAQFDEWNEFKELTFSILEYPLHKGVFNLVKDLGKLYLNSRPLYELDNDPRGFNWLDVNNALESTIAFERVDLDGNKLICIFNFTPVYRKDYKVQVDEAGNYSILINASHKKYGGNVEKNSWYKAIRQDFRYKKYYINVNLEPFGALIIEKKRDKNEK